MNRDEIMEAIKSLSASQGFYTRLYARLCDFRDNDPDKFDECMTELEKQNFKDPVDMVLFLEG